MAKGEQGEVQARFCAGKYLEGKTDRQYMSSPIVIDGLSKEAEAALKEFLKRCMELNHTLNNPLTGIMGYTECLLMSSKHLTPEDRQYLQEIMKASERIKQTVEWMVEAKMQLGKHVDLRGFVEPTK